jgi:hypothetical protein
LPIGNVRKIPATILATTVFIPWSDLFIKNFPACIIQELLCKKVLSSRRSRRLRRDFIIAFFAILNSH